MSVTVMMATESFYEQVKARDGLPPVYRFPEQAARALSQLYRYSEWRRRPVDAEVPEFEVDDEAVARILDSREDGYLEQEDAFRVLTSVADYFRRTEPHSPISFLLERAVRWGRLPLPR